MPYRQGNSWGTRDAIADGRGRCPGTRCGGREPRTPVFYSGAETGPRPPPPGQHPGFRGERRQPGHGQRPGIALLGQDHRLDQRRPAGEHEETSRPCTGNAAWRGRRTHGQSQGRADPRQGPRRGEGSRRRRDNPDPFREARAQAVKVRAYGETAAASGERGFALIVILSLAALISAYLIATVLNLTGAGLANAREERSMNALRQAKAALIAYAASEQWQLYKGQTTNQPGGLPCPDTDDDGDSEGLCSNALSRIGRLPWKSIGAEDLRDASGERLWYAVSSNFRRLSGTTVINSDTQGLLTVTGTAPASNVVAIVFAPGPPVLGQDRSTGHNDPAAYLEGFTAGANNYTFTTTALP